MDSKKGKGPLTLVVNALVWLIVALSCFFFFAIDLIIWLLTFWWDKRLWLLHRYSCVWAMSYFWLNPFWRISIEGQENISDSRPCVIISNHQSAFDIALLYRIFRHFKWVAKRELLKVPFIGWNLLLNRHILVDRESKQSGAAMMKKGMMHLKQGSSVFIFPEGTRSPDGRVKRFKEGAFVLAKRAGVPIVPIVIDGSFHVLSRGGLIKLKQNFVIRILPEIPVESVVDKEPDALALEANRLVVECHRGLAPELYEEPKNPNGLSA